MKILFKYATRSRPALFKRGVESILNNVTNDNYHILVSVDVDDYSAIEAVREYYTHPNITVVFGVSKNKVDAINRDLDLIKEWDILVNMSDDMVFVQHGFDYIIRQQFESLDLCLHFPDGNRNDLITMSIIGREYYNRFGYIYNNEYKSLYCDNEQTDVSKLLGKYKFVNENIFVHLHPAYNKAVFDKQYQYTESFNLVDSQTFLRRKENNYGM